MLSRWPIRYKLMLGVATMFLIVAGLSFSGFKGVYAYRELAKTISRRADELPIAAKLVQNTAELRHSVERTESLLEFDRNARDLGGAFSVGYVDMMRGEFRVHLLAVNQSLEDYRKQIDTPDIEESRIGDRHKERETVAKIERTLKRINDINQSEDWFVDDLKLALIKPELDELNLLANELPTFLQGKMNAFTDQARGEYRAWIVMTWLTTILANVVLIVMLFFLNYWIFRPLGVLIDGSRRVAGGDFSHRIQLRTRDEVSELATAMNNMTSSFCEVRDDLDNQVQQRTKEVVRSERLASVGFLAAGVAHEINNPMASVAWAAESLESRIDELLPESQDEETREEVAIVHKYLRRIQDEAFRCKGITEKLLDFSRMGDAQRQETNLHELTVNVIEMVRHVGKYRNKTIECSCDQHVIAAVNAQEIKQVVLNLVTNSLDSLEADGVVQVRLQRHRDGRHAELVVSDNGCGMTPDVQEHLFEPFFTRRRDGQGTGLGLSITYQIINDHGGRIAADSDGPGLGSTFRIVLPLAQTQAKTHEEKNQAA